MHVVIVGYGRAGRQHAAAIERTEKVRVRAIVEPDENVDAGPYERAASWSDILADPDVDGVALCIPPGRRAEMALQALAAGKAVLLEKPPAMSLEEFERLARAPGRVTVMLQHRYRLPDEAVEGWNGGSTGTLVVSRPRSDKHFSGWRGDPGQALGGITAHLGVHYLDIACQLLGKVERVEIGHYRECAPGIDVRTAGTILFESGATLAFTVAADVDARAEHLVLAGEGGRRLEIRDGAVRLQDGQRVTDFPAAPTAELRTRVYEEFAGAPGRCALEPSRDVVAVLDEVRRAGER
ncbi:Gfo/Idh/MocA family protein [Thermoactinospora rubra]|uniref:Gfo/Idh/MocA family protein n=1 Tax=Thermoactinospora rubra TaxID=1088767 RepID=UPI001301CC2B|nr:Gfo/Idh/MocA family oxidoreductase [Thermoactinospora rubra]